MQEFTSKQKKDKQPEKVIDLESKEGTEDIDAESVEPITKLPKDIPPHKGKAKVTKDLDYVIFIISTPLLSEQSFVQWRKLTVLW